VTINADDASAIHSMLHLATCAGSQTDKILDNKAKRKGM
jgi:hypothetical protein